MLEKR